MTAWADYCATVKSGNVIPIVTREASGMTKPTDKGIKLPDLLSPLSNAFEMFGDEAKEKLDRLANRLGIQPIENRLHTWALVGWVLAQETREFRKRGRGRPSLKDKREPGIDYERYRYLRNHCRELGEELGKSITHEAAIERAMDEGAPLFFKDKDLLIASVSRGRAVFEKARRENQRMWGASLRADCASFKKREEWLRSAKDTVTRLEEMDRNPTPPQGLLSALIDPERQALLFSLRNPFRWPDG
jgi:hypothetical protein